MPKQKPANPVKTANPLILPPLTKEQTKKITNEFKQLVFRPETPLKIVLERIDKLEKMEKKLKPLRPQTPLPASIFEQIENMEKNLNPIDNVKNGKKLNQSKRPQTPLPAYIFEQIKEMEKKEDKLTDEEKTLWNKYDGKLPEIDAILPETVYLLVDEVKMTDVATTANKELIEFVGNIPNKLNHLVCWANVSVSIINKQLQTNTSLDKTKLKNELRNIITNADGKGFVIEEALSILIPGATIRIISTVPIEQKLVLKYPTMQYVGNSNVTVSAFFNRVSNLRKTEESTDTIRHYQIADELPTPIIIKKK